MRASPPKTTLTRRPGSSAQVADHLAARGKGVPERHSRDLGKHVVPRIGDVRVTDVNAHLIDDVYTGLPPAPSSVQQIHKLLSVVLEQAVDWELRRGTDAPCHAPDRARDRAGGDGAGPGSTDH